VKKKQTNKCKMLAAYDKNCDDNKVCVAKEYTSSSSASALNIDVVGLLLFLQFLAFLFVW